jgi:predicted transcriptional regulator
MAEKASTKTRHFVTEEAARRRLNEAVAMNLDLEGMDLRVFLYMSARLNFEKPVHVPQMEIAALLGKQRTHISRALRRLVEMGILLPGPGGTRTSEWMLNPDYGT